MRVTTHQGEVLEVDLRGEILRAAREWEAETGGSGIAARMVRNHVLREAAYSPDLTMEVIQRELRQMTREGVLVREVQWEYDTINRRDGRFGGRSRMQRRRAYYRVREEQDG